MPVRHEIEYGNEDGSNREVLVDEQDGTTIIAGHHVVKAARRLGWTHIAVSKANENPDDDDHPGEFDE